MFNICLLGNSGTGKTSWLNRVKYGDWSPNFNPTDTTSEVELELDDETFVEIRDTAGQWKYNPDIAALTDVDLFMVFASDYKISQKHVKDWISIGHKYSPNARIMVVVNKCELKNKVFPKTISGKPVIALSAKSCENWDAPLKIIQEYSRSKHGIQSNL